MAWTEQKGDRYESLRARAAYLTDTERVELAELAVELNGVETAFANEEVQRKLTKRTDVYDNEKPAPRQSTNFRWLWPVVVGLIAGATLFGRFFRSPGDPSGFSIGAGWGGVIGLAVALVLRLILNRKQ